MPAPSSTALSFPVPRWVSSKAPYLLFALAIVLCFSSGIGAGYLLDDKTSVMPMQALRDDGSLFWYFVLSDGSGPLGRPISAFTFAIERSEECRSVCLCVCVCLTV